MQAYTIPGKTTQSEICGVCNQAHETGRHTPETVCVQALLAQVDDLQTQLTAQTDNCDGLQGDVRDLLAGQAALTQERDKLAEQGASALKSWTGATNDLRRAREANAALAEENSELTLLVGTLRQERDAARG